MNTRTLVCLTLLLILSSTSVWCQGVPTPPVLVSSDPVEGSRVNVPVTAITMTFSQSIIRPTLVVTRFGTPVAGTTANGATGSIVVWTPTAGTLSDGSYNVDMSKLQGANGMSIGPPQFLTFEQDTTRPTLVSSSPTAGQANVPIDTTVVLSFSETLAATPVVMLTGPGGPVSLLLSSRAESTYTFAPVGPLAYSSTYTVDFSAAADLAGNLVAAPSSFSFSTGPPPALALISSLPVDGQPDVPVVQPISLTFNNPMNATASSVLVRSATETVSGSLNAVGSTLIFTPTSPLRLATEYTVQFAGARDAYGQAPTGISQLTFRTELGGLTGYVDPQMISLSAGERAGVTYLIQNTSSAPVTLRSSTAEFLVNGAVVTTVNVPASITIPAHSIGTLASDASIDQQIQDAARAAGTDQVVMMRTFRETAGGLEVNVPLAIRIGASLAGAATVTEIILDVPPDGKSVSQSDEIRGHAFIRGTGSGAIVGTWFVDDRPVETFQLNLTAGLTQEVSTRMSLPTLELGPHSVELRVIRPVPVSSGIKQYIVTSGDSASQRVYLVRPRLQTPLLPDAVRTTFRWAPMPGASAYEIAFASDLGSLGLSEDGKPIFGPLGRKVWTPAEVAAGKLSLLARVPVDVVAWTPTPEEYATLFANSGGGSLYWAVRAVYPAQATGDPSTTSQPGTVALLPKPAPLSLLTPADGAAVKEIPQFQWQPGPAGVTYEFSIGTQGRTVYKALTRDTSYTIGSLSAFKPAAGDYWWQVSAVSPGAGVVAASDRRKLTFAAQQGNASPEATSVNGQAAAVVLAAGHIIPLPGAAALVTITPADGASIAESQPVISATYPEAKPGQVLVMLNGVDVTSLAAVTSTGFTLQPPGVFSEGQHTVAVVVETVSGQRLEAASRFAITAAAATAAAEETDYIPHPLQVDLNWNWQNQNEATGFDGLTIDVNLRGQQTWAGRNGTFAAMNFQVARPGGEKLDLANFLAEGGIQKGLYKAMVGDTGASESELTAQGLMYRAFSFVSNAGPLKLMASHTLGQAIQRSSIGRAPDLLLFTAESANSTPQQGLKLSYVDSENDLPGSSSFSGQTKSKVLSISGRTPLGATGLNLRAELANSDSTVVSAFGSQGQNGTGFNAVVDGIAWGCGLSATYRRTGSDYFSPASSTLTNDIKGWTFGINRPIGRFLNATSTYSTMDNVGGSSTPESSLTSKAIDLTYARPNWPALSVKLSRNNASSDPFVAGSRPGDTEENVWSATASYANKLWNGYLSYSRSDFDDFFDFIDPTLDTPNDRRNDTWAVGFGIQPMRTLRLRLDWGANDVDRWFRPLFAPLPLAGTDRSDQFRAQAEYVLNNRLSASLVWTNSDYNDALGVYQNSFKEASFRLNYLLKLTQAGGGFVVTGEWRRADVGGNVAGNNGTELMILINDNAVLSF